MIRLPNDSQRLCVVGATGTGKTFAGLWNLSMRSFTNRPWVIYDFKGDELIAQTGATEIGVDAPVPVHPGLYIVRPLPHEAEAVSDQMMEIWQRGNVGVFVDEAFMLGRNSTGFRALLTQGRSRSIPLIYGTQRPVFVDRYAFSEASFMQIFRLQSDSDVFAIGDFIPRVSKMNRSERTLLFENLPTHYSFYYDVGNNSLVRLEKVPDAETILDTFHTRLESIREVA